MDDLNINVHNNIRIKDSLKLHHRSGEKLKSRNKPVRETIQYVDDEKSQIISLERTEEETKVYHEGKLFKNDKLIIHPKHLRSYKKHNKNE